MPNYITLMIKGHPISNMFYLGYASKLESASSPLCV